MRRVTVHDNNTWKLRFCNNNKDSKRAARTSYVTWCREPVTTTGTLQVCKIHALRDAWTYLEVDQDVIALPHRVQSCTFRHEISWQIYIQIYAYANGRRLCLYLFSLILVHACISGLDIGFAYTQQAHAVVLTSMRREAYDVISTSCASWIFVLWKQIWAKHMSFDWCVYVQVCTDFYTCVSSRNLHLSPPFLWNGQI